MIIIIFLFLLIPINVHGLSYVVSDIDSGRILESSNANSSLLIASTTKIMTCIITLENADINKKVTVGDEILGVDGTNIYLSLNEEISIKDLLYGLMLRSGNDAAMVLSYNVFDDYDTFIDKMNDKAKELGMNKTSFSNPHGLDDNTSNKSTAYDMSLLGSYAYKNDIYREIISTKKYATSTNLKSYLWYNRVSILNNYKYSTGGKNGYTPKAGKCLVSYAEKDNLRLIIVSLNDGDIYERHKRLYNKYLNEYHNYMIVDKNKFYIDSSLIDGNYYIKDSFYYPLSDDEIDDVSTLIRIDNNSRIIVKLKDKEIGNISIYKKSENKKKDNNIFQKIASFFKKLIA